MDGEHTEIIEQLTRTERLVLVLKWGESLEENEVAQVLEISPAEVGAVSQRLKSLALESLATRRSHGVSQAP